MVHTLVVGGTRGVGREVVIRLASRGHMISVIGKRPASTDEMISGELKFWTIDIADGDALTASLESILSRGKLSNLVFAHRYRGNNDTWDGELMTSLTATKKIIEFLADQFTESSNNSIVITSSIASHLVADEQPVGYHVAKAGMNQMARYYAVQLGSRGIRVNTVSPSIFIKEESREYYQKNPELCRLFSKITPLGRMGTSAEIAAVIDFLCCQDASFITGQDIVVDGGVSIQAHSALVQKVCF